MTQLSISKAWEESVAFVAREGKLLFPVAFVFLALPQVVIGLIMPDVDADKTKTLAAMMELMRPEMPQLMASFVLSNLIGLVGGLSLYALSTRPGISVGEAIGVALGRFLPALAAGLLLGLVAVLGIGIPMGMIQGGAIGPGALLLLIAAPLFAFAFVRLILLNVVIVEESKGPIAAIKRAWDLTKGKFWKLFGFFLVMGIVLLIASFAATVVFGVLDALTSETNGKGILSLIAEAIVGTVFNVYVLVVIVRLYRQLSGG